MTHLKPFIHFIRKVFLLSTCWVTSHSLEYCLLFGVFSQRNTQYTWALTLYSMYWRVRTHTHARTHAHTHTHTHTPIVLKYFPSYLLLEECKCTRRGCVRMNKRAQPSVGFLITLAAFRTKLSQAIPRTFPNPLNRPEPPAARTAPPSCNTWYQNIYETLLSSLNPKHCVCKREVIQQLSTNKLNLSSNIFLPVSLTQFHSDVSITYYMGVVGGQWILT